MSDAPLAREGERMRARLEALITANATPRCGARSKRTGKPCRAAAMPNGRCKVHGGKSTGPRTPEGLERSRANWKHGHFSGKPRRNGRACGQQYLRSAICACWVIRLVRACTHKSPSHVRFRATGRTLRPPDRYAGRCRWVQEHWGLRLSKK